MFAKIEEERMAIEEEKELAIERARVAEEELQERTREMEDLAASMREKHSKDMEDAAARNKEFERATEERAKVSGSILVAWTMLMHESRNSKG